MHTMKTHITILLGILLVLICISPANAWLTGYNYRQNCTINGSTNWGGSVSNYQVPFLVYTTSGSSSGNTLYLNGNTLQTTDDIRFTDTSDSEYDYWIEEHTAEPYWVWVEIPTLTTGMNDVCVYYGNSTVDAYSNGENTFFLFDNYNAGALNTSLWTKYGTGSFTFTGGLIYQVSVGDNTGIYNSTLYATNYSVRMRTNFSTSNLPTSQAGAGWIQSGLSGKIAAAWGGGYAWPSLTHRNFFAYNTGVHNTDTDEDELLHVYDIARNGTTSIVEQIDNVVEHTETTQVATGNLIVFQQAGSFTNEELYSDWLAVRNYRFSSPSVGMWEAEEPNPTCTPPVANFNSTGDYLPYDYTCITNTGPGNELTFYDQSENATAWYWLFEDGETNTSQNAWRHFDYYGKHTVMLNVSNACGYSWKNVTDYVRVWPGPLFGITYAGNVTMGDAPLTVMFNVTSGEYFANESVYYWDVDNDGVQDYSTANATHTYSTPGNYTVNLRHIAACNDITTWENKTNYITVNATATPTPTPTPTSTPTPVPTPSPTIGPSSWELPTCSNVTTLVATGVGVDSVTMNGNATSFVGDTVWFRWGSAPGTLPLATDGINVTSASTYTVSSAESGPPLFPGHTYYYRLCADCGCSANEENFTTLAMTTTLVPIDTLYSDAFIEGADDDFNMTGMVETGIDLYMENMGTMFWGVLLLFFFVGIFMRQELPIMPLMLAVIGMTILAPVVPPEWYQFVLGAAVVTLVGIIIYVIWGRRAND